MGKELENDRSSPSGPIGALTTTRNPKGCEDFGSPPEYRDRMRALMVNSTLHIGGAERVAACIAQHIDPSKIRMTACYLKEPGTIAEQMQHAGVRIVPIPGLKAGRKDYLSFLKLRQLIQTEQIELIHTHDVHGMMDGSACRLTMRSLKHVHTFHFGNYPDLPGRYKKIESLLWRVPDAIVAVGNAQANAIRALYRIPDDRLRVIRNGVEDPSSLTDGARRLVMRQPGVPVIASISTLIPQKGLEHLLEAAALLKESGERFQLVIAGEGMLRESLERRANRLAISDSVTFLGWVPQASTQLLPECDIFVQSSLWEAMSVVVLEAMAAAKPMVVTDVGENAFVVEHERSALIVPPANPGALAAALRNLLRHPELASSLADAARRRYEENFRLHNMVAAYERLYCELLDGWAADERVAR